MIIFQDHRGSVELADEGLAEDCTSGEYLNIFYHFLSKNIKLVIMKLSNASWEVLKADFSEQELYPALIVRAL